MFYEELRDGVWERIEIDGEMLMGRAHHVIYFATPERWLGYPAWARGRRDEIVARITSEFREPDYEYYGLAGPATQSSAPPVSAAATSASPGKRAKARAMHRAVLVVVLALFAVAALMGWVVASGVARGETRLPLKQATFRRTVSRDREPATFWVAVGLYSALGAGALATGAFVAREARRG